MLADSPVFWFLLPTLIAVVAGVVDWNRVDPIIPYGKVSVPDERYMALGGLLIVAICLWFDRP